MSEPGNFHYAGFWIRSVAALVDELILNVTSLLIFAAFVGAFFWGQRLLGDGGAVTFEAVFGSFVSQIALIVISVAVSGVYYVIGHYRYGTTLGKKVFRIYVVNAEGYGPISVEQSVTRAVAYALSYAILGCGFFMAGFHPRKQGLHDIIAKTVSIRRDR